MGSSNLRRRVLGGLLAAIRHALLSKLENIHSSYCLVSQCRSCKSKEGKARRWLAGGGSRAKSKKWLDSREILEMVEPLEIAGELTASRARTMEDSSRDHLLRYIDTGQLLGNDHTLCRSTGSGAGAETNGFGCSEG